MADSLFFGVLGAIAAGVAATLGVRRYYQRVLAGMNKTVSAMAAGNRTVRTRLQAQDELGKLGRSIDQMAEALNHQMDVGHREEGRLRTILDSMTEGVLVTNREGNVILTNTALSNLFGDKVLSKTIIEAVRKPELHEAAQQALKGGATPVVFEIGTADKARKVVEAQVAPLPLQDGVVVVFHDITAQKEADEVRRDFIANASHELRTPLTAIRGFAETLNEGALNEPAVAKRFVQTIVENSVRLQRLVDDLLVLSRAESPDQHVELKPVKVVAITKKVLQGLESQARAKSIYPEVQSTEPEIIALADEQALDQVLINLVDNAIKYTPERGEVKVHIHQTNEHVLLEVKDTGLGIAPIHLKRIFERFYRVDHGRARAEGGTGLGLSIVKHLVQRLNGEVSVQSVVGQGSTFRIQLRR